MDQYCDIESRVRGHSKWPRWHFFVIGYDIAISLCHWKPKWHHVWLLISILQSCFVPFLRYIMSSAAIVTLVELVAWFVYELPSAIICIWCSSVCYNGLDVSIGSVLAKQRTERLTCKLVKNRLTIVKNQQWLAVDFWWPVVYSELLWDDVIIW